MAKKISTDFPINEITLRKYEKPYNLSRRDLVKKVCLSLGLLQPGDSRDVVVDIFYCLLENKLNNKMVSSEEIRQWVTQYRTNEKMELIGVAPSNIRRQLKRLRDIFLIEKVTNNYRISENLFLSEIFAEKIKKIFIPSIIGRINDYIDKIDESFYKNSRQF